MFIVALFTIVKKWKQHICPLTDEQLKKMWFIYTMENYSAIKIIEITTFVAIWIDLKIIILSEISQKEKDKCHMISHIWNLKYNTIELIYEIETGRQKIGIDNIGCQGGGFWERDGVGGQGQQTEAFMYRKKNPTKSYCITQGIIYPVPCDKSQWKRTRKIMYIYDRATILYSSN